MQRGRPVPLSTCPVAAGDVMTGEMLRVRDRVLFPKWTPAEEGMLERLRAEGLNNREIAERLGRTHDAVCLRARQTGLTQKAPLLRDWSENDIARLRDLRAQGLSAREIGEALARSPQAVRFKTHQLGLPRPSRIRRSDPVERFWCKVNQRGPSECWEWQGTRSTRGYGLFSYNGRSVRAHRFAYEHRVGPIPAGAEIRHRCDNPPCCNPAHLEVGTHDENMADMVERKRSASGSRNSRWRHGRYARAA